MGLLNCVKGSVNLNVLYKVTHFANSCLSAGHNVLSI
jgi:hypothetical protein